MNGTGVPAGSSAHNASNVGRTILNDDEIRRALTRIAFEILESNKGTDHLVLIGIRSRGYPLAQRLAQRIQANDSNFDLEDGLGALILPRTVMTSPMRNTKTAARGSP